MNMPIGRLFYPEGWQLRQEIATNLQTAAYDRYLVDVAAPDGSLIRGLGSATYFHAGGATFDSLVERMALAGVQGIQDLSYGEFTPNERVMSRPKYQQAIERARANGIQLEAVHLPFQGTISDRAVEGRLEVDHSLFTEGGQHVGGIVNVVLLMSAPGKIESLIRTSDAISERFQANPQYDGARSRVIDQATARMSEAHQRRMAQNQAQFNAHQEMMKGRYEASYAQNDQWLKNFRSGGGSGSGSQEYSGHEKFIDSLRETTSFDDPNSASRTSQDGQFERWATDGQGNYIGSDDPNFDPGALEGNWQEAQPLD